MSVRKYDWIESLEENPKDVYLDSTSVLLKLMDNVITSPLDPKFRSIRLANSTVSKKLMPAIGAMECLFEMGFEEEDDKLTLPQNVPLERLKRIRDEITIRRNTYLSSHSGQNQQAKATVNVNSVTASEELPAETSQNGEVSVSRNKNAASGKVTDHNSQNVETSVSRNTNAGSAEVSDQSHPTVQASVSRNTNAGSAGEYVTSSVTGHKTVAVSQHNVGAVSKNKNSAVSGKVSAETSQHIATAATNNSKNTVAATVPKTSPTKVHHSQFLQSVRNYSYAVLQYENKELQSRALKLIPVGELVVAAERKMRDIRVAMKKSQSKEEDIDIKELLLMELLTWFKSSFFSWVDAPVCDYCHSPTKFTGLSNNPQDLIEANRVEAYSCKSCSRQTLFPRHQDPAKLLETRKGRCGEWASCFTLLCRAMGWDARHVVDQTDHVWTEVYSLIQGRWLHCDPCENVCDRPLMYEKGWGKQLSYVMAYSCDDVQDVTWRYSSQHHAILSHRTLCTEEELLATMWQLRQERQRGLSVARRTFLTRRLLSELVEFLLPQQPSQAEFQGRTSGSLAWRMARGETGAPASVATFVWEPNNVEKTCRTMEISYSAARDLYVRGSSCEEIKQWENGVFQADCVFRKEEKDWKITYLARAEGSEKGTIKWKVDCGRSGLVVDSVHVRCFGTVFETGKVMVTLCNEDTCLQVPSGNSNFETSALRGSRSFTLCVQLSGGKGAVAWQHAQLFRQAFDDVTNYPLNILVKFQDP